MKRNIKLTELSIKLSLQERNSRFFHSANFSSTVIVTIAAERV